MKRFKGTKGKWSVEEFNYVISATPNSNIQREGYHDEDELSLYGGYLIAENILSSHDAQLMATAPELLRVLIGMTLSMKAHPDYHLGKNQEFVDYVESAEQVINKALGHD